jgi:hypothetical protein
MFFLQTSCIPLRLGVFAVKKTYTYLKHRQLVDKAMRFLIPFFYKTEIPGGIIEHFTIETIPEAYRHRQNRQRCLSGRNAELGFQFCLKILQRIRE